ncbi:DHH family phosphoesterase [Anaerovorax odorimutans]|uniref:DHH family phosphoesterase n=1 Tax=Anaerovorax odorimutans TaxID=109327 RepID=UPI000421E385|nr:bifunctional oligoribonuclease/PAP phosphatase NrnA [Anaerovorax odorimutans]
MKNIANVLIEAEKILIFTHILMDGDTLGSSVALCKQLRKAGKQAYILIEDNIPAYLAFLNKDYCSYDFNIIEKPDICVAVDCSDIGRLGMRKDKFFQGEITICVDHHTTNDYFAQLNYVKEDSSSTGEIMYQLLKKLKIDMDQEIAEALYAAITTDTGNFQYTNTTKNTHLIVAKLFDYGIDLEKVSVELYQNIRHEKILITNEALNTIEMICDGKADIAYVTLDMLNKTAASMDETEGIIETLRNINGVEISAFLKEQEENKIKVGFRAKTYGDVSIIAKKFGGGGHKKAAGCTIFAPLSKSLDMVKDAIKEQLDKK